MNDIEASSGLSQLKRLLNSEKRKNLVKRYNSKLKKLPIHLPLQIKDSSSSWHLYIILIRSTALKSRDQVFKEMRDKGIGVNLHYIPIYKQPFYKKIKN